MNRWFPIGLAALAAMTGALLGCGGSGPEWSPTQAAVTPTMIEDDGGVTQSGVEKVTICHIPPGNPGNAHTITVGRPAVAAHVAEHGDTIGPCQEPTAHLVVIKHVINDCEGNAKAEDFTITVSGVTVVGDNPFLGAEAPGTDLTLSSVGAYSVGETGPTDGYQEASYSADCSGTIALGETKTCTVTNDDWGRCF